MEKTNAGLQAVRQKVVAKGKVSGTNCYVAKAEGSLITDVEGNEYIDFMNNYTVLIFGHADHDINKAISNRLKKGVLLGAPSQNQYELGRLICDRVDSVDRVRFCNTGTEVVMYALRAARAVTGKEKILKFEGGFHGNTEQVEISLSPNIDIAGPANRPISVPDTEGITQGILRDVIVAPFNDIDATNKIIDENKDHIAAVITEPMLGYSGMVPGKKEFLKFLREITAKNNIPRTK